ncbi:MAG: THUMP domain-containing protein, partial [Candidatus Rhabdochlamydia sp.]
MHLFISCPPRLEALLTEELNSLNIEARVWPRGASAPLSMENVYRINMESHLATRVLWPLKSFTCTDRETLYEEALSIEWDEWLTPETTFAVDANVTDNEGFRHSHFAALVVKDAICDYFRDKVGERPSVDLQDPAVQFNLFIFKDKATISFDTSGAPLFKRGYRAASVQAPLQETLAASLLKMSRYTADDILCDPYCGSGTILWEASLMATHTPAGFFRKSWGFFKHPLFSQAAWDAYLLSLEAKRVPLKPFSIFGSDRDLKTVEVCRSTQRATNLAADFQHSDIRFLRLPVIPTLVVTNPPYGVRMQSNTDPYIALARFLETTCQGQAHAAILSPLRKLPGKFPGRFTQPVPIVNGGMDIFVHLLEAGGTSASYARNTQEESPQSEDHSSDADSYTSSSHEDALNDQTEQSDDVQLEQSSTSKEDSLAHESTDQSEHSSDVQDDSLAHLLDDDFDTDGSDDSDDDESDDDQPAVSKAAPSGNRPARRFGDKSFAPRDRSSNDRPRRPFGDRP